MPYKSLAQERYFNANRAKLEAQGVNVDEWNKASKGMKLPKKVPVPKQVKAPKAAKAPTKIKTPRAMRAPKVAAAAHAAHSPLIKLLGLTISPTSPMHPLLKGPR